MPRQIKTHHWFWKNMHIWPGHGGKSLLYCVVLTQTGDIFGDAPAAKVSSPTSDANGDFADFSRARTLSGSNDFGDFANANAAQRYDTTPLNCLFQFDAFVFHVPSRLFYVV